MKQVLCLAALLFAGCMVGDAPECYDEADTPVECESLGAVAELASQGDALETYADADAPADYLPGPDDLDGPADEAVEVPLADDPDVAAEATLLTAAGSAGAGQGGGADGRTDVTAGQTKNAELFKLLPIGKKAGAQRYVVMRLRPSDLPNLAVGDTIRGASEIQVTTACDIGQTGPMCGYSPNVRMQLVLAGGPDQTDTHKNGVVALSGVQEFSCNSNDHHCVKTIDFKDASMKLTQANAPACVANNSCYVNLVIWAYESHARSGGKDKLIIGANEGDFLQNGNSEQDRGRVMLVRERDITPADKFLRATKHNVKSGTITFGSNGDDHRIYSHTLKGGQDLVKGEKFRVWADMNATSDSRVNVDIMMFLTKNRTDHNGGHLDEAKPSALDEHNGSNCSPGNPCHLHKVALFEVTQDVKGPVYINITSSAEVPGPGSANVAIHDDGYIKTLRYSR